MRKSSLLGSIALVCAALVAQPQPSVAGESNFYTPPSTLPASNGALVRTEPMKLGAKFDFLGTTVFMDGTATRIMYKSVDEVGAAVGVTGVYIEPNKAWSGSGARPFVSLAVGTQGVGDACAPSKTLEKVINVEDSKFMVGYELPAINGFLDKGVAVVVTDYIGLGTTDRVHTYTNRLDMAHAVLDAARAALKLPNTSINASSPVGLFGYSQGGAGAAAAVELAPSYAPELNIKGAYAGAPPANLYDVMKSADGSSLTGVIAWAINGIFGYRPALTGQLQTLLNDRGEAFLANSTDQCVVDAVLTSGFAKTSSFTTSGKSARDEVKNYPQLMAAINDQRIGNLKPNVPVQVLTGTLDDIVDHAQARQLAKDWCAKGVNVTYKPVIQLIPTFGTGGNHVTPAATDMISSRNWLIDRLKGKSVKSNCSSMWLLP